MAKSPARKLLELAGGGAVALTLSACYGLPPDYRPAPTTPDTTCGPSEDVDGDGYCADDCDEIDPETHPGADDPPGDALDQNCDGRDGHVTEAAPKPAADSEPNDTDEPADAVLAAPPE